MTLVTLCELIATVGFPCVICCVLLFYVFKIHQEHKVDINTLTKEFAERVESITNKHKEEMLVATRALQSNTTVMTQILEQMRKGGD